MSIVYGLHDGKQTNYICLQNLHNVVEADCRVVCYHVKCSQSPVMYNNRTNAYAWAYALTLINPICDTLLAVKAFIAFKH